MKPQSIALCALAGLLCVAVLAGVSWKGQRDTLEERLSTRTLERDTALRTAEGWKKQAEEEKRKTLALQGNVTDCLEREQQATAAAEEWRVILENAQSRDMAPEEKEKVPDESTRRRLFDALDRPL